MTAGRAVAALAVGLSLAVTSSGCSGPTVTATRGCSAPVRPPLQEGGHLLGDTAPPVPWSSVPPTSGWHASGAGPAAGVYGSPVPDAELVAALEQGRVVVAHAEDLDPAERAAATTLVGEIDGLVVTPYELAPGDPPVALLAWGVLQRCTTVDPDAVAAFAEVHGGVDRER